MSILNEPVLVLNKSYTAVHINSVREAIIKICLGVADAIDTNDHSRYEWDTWRDINPTGNGQKFIQTSHDFILAPKIIILKDYNKIPVFEVKLTRRNVFIRDNFRCQYSGRKLRINEATLDHIVPESRGGKSDWNNLVTCDRAINSKKGHKTLAEAGLKLINYPKKPHWNPLFCATLHIVPQEWTSYLSRTKNK